MPRRFHVRFVRPNGWIYELWPMADDEAGAVLVADDLLEYVDRTGIRDYLNPDGLTVRPPAELAVRFVETEPPSEGTVRYTRPDGSVTWR